LILTAESLTGGNIAGTLAKIERPGFDLAGGIITYATAVKNGLLNFTDHDELKVMS
jgi:nicotinamide mononucleotide (NMN) deamidase PncC